MTNQADEKQRFAILLKHKANLLIAAVVLVLIIIFSGSGTDQDKMLAAQSDHDHEQALLIASKLLEQNPSDSSAKAVLKKSGQLFSYLQQAKLAFNQGQASTNKSTTSEQLLTRLNDARTFTAKAQTIDPKAERLLAFESKLNEAEDQLGYILSKDALASGQALITEVSSKYRLITEIIETADTSAYLTQFMTFQSSGANMGKPVEEIKENIEPYLQQMQKTSQFLASTDSKDQSLNQMLAAYITTVTSTTDTLLAPQGTFKDFASSADKAMSQYKQSLKKLKSKLSQHDSTDDNIIGIVDRLTKYKVFHDHSIYQIMAANKSFFE